MSGVDSGASSTAAACNFGALRWWLMASMAPPPGVPDDSDWRWDDGDWMRVRGARHQGDLPLAFYCLDAAEWYASRFSPPLRWDALIQELVPYVADLGFTHVAFDAALLAEGDATIRGVIETCHIAGVGVVVCPPDDTAQSLERCRRLHVDGVYTPTDEDQAGHCRLFVDDGRADVILAFRPTWQAALSDYLGRPPLSRCRHHAQWIAALTPASKGRALLAQMPAPAVPLGAWRQRVHGDAWQRFATLRAALGMMWALPGEKWLGMGVELGQVLAERFPEAIHWPLLFESRHAGMLRLVADLNRLYVNEPALQIRDDGDNGFEWLVPDDGHNSVVVFARHADSGHATLICVSNFQACVHQTYRFGVPAGGRWREIFNSDSVFYAGSNVGNGRSLRALPEPSHGQAQSLTLTVPPMATLFLRHEVWHGDTP